MSRQIILASLEEDILGGLESLGLPGAALGIIEGGEIAALQTYGLADKARGRPVTEDTLFSLQSISKSLAAWGVMRLVEEGRIDLDRPIDDYLVRWKLPETAFDRRLVTARRLLSHHAGVSIAGFPGITSAFPDVTLIDGLNGNLPPLTVEQEAYWRRWDLGTDWAARLAYPPGEGWRYSNAGFGILEVAIEDITGSTFATFMDRTILAPLGLLASGYNLSEADKLAIAYGEDGRPRERLRY